MNQLSLHFLHRSFALFLVGELNEPVSFRHSGNRVADYFSFDDGREVLLKGLKKHRVSYCAVEVTDVDLVFSGPLVLLGLLYRRCVLWILMGILIVMLMPVEVLLAWLSSSNASSVRCPVQLEDPVRSWNGLAI